MVFRVYVEKKEVQMFESNYVVNTTFGGSLPSFIASFVSGKDLSKKDRFLKKWIAI